MAASLAATTGGVFGYILGQPEPSHTTTFGGFGVLAGLPTFVVGLVWALILRSRATVGSTNLRVGWLASLPLAALNGALGGGLFMLSSRTVEDSQPAVFLLGALLGVTVGSMFWVPGLLATLAFFGAPLAWSQKLAEKGLAGEERGERVVGIASALLATLGALIALRGTPETSGALGTVGLALLYLFSACGVVAGALAVGMASAREKRRRQFVDEVSKGNVAGYRVDDSSEGKVLVRVTSIGAGYRVANFEEELYELDEMGNATHAPKARVANVR
ncbi:hypothetical protein AKJ09_09172 [Labilithrix luteola]|uniref:Uncharacterized protein n=1 Tax=Labilithrix luteola TaxID=1391654 RepID=A0A0K1Q9U2_9BACT|nr:hypothetical protein [Labilithrix luteola]AKV02509.1 hypothetical protein AKJ09_09172 [Labilithrix luteola]